MTTEAARILTAMEDEARYVVRTATIDLDAFLFLKGEARAAQWRQWDEGAKFQAVALMLERKEGDWTVDGVAFWTAHYNEKYAVSPIEQAVEGALERLADESAQTARLARGAGDKDGATHWSRATTAYTNALIEYRKGVRPDLLDSGAWLLPSRRSGEPPHIVRMDGDWVCGCKAGASMHWPIALVIACEVAGDDLDRFDGGDEEEAPQETAADRATMGRRLCAARSRYLEAA